MKTLPTHRRGCFQAPPISLSAGDVVSCVHCSQTHSLENSRECRECGHAWTAPDHTSTVDNTAPDSCLLRDGGVTNPVTFFNGRFAKAMNFPQGHSGAWTGGGTLKFSIEAGCPPTVDGATDSLRGEFSPLLPQLHQGPSSEQGQWTQPEGRSGI